MKRLGWLAARLLLIVLASDYPSLPRFILSLSKDGPEAPQSAIFLRSLQIPEGALD